MKAGLSVSLNVKSRSQIGLRRPKPMLIVRKQRQIAAGGRAYRRMFDLVKRTLSLRCSYGVLPSGDKQTLVQTCNCCVTME